MADRAGGDNLSLSEVGRALLDPLGLAVLGGTGVAFAVSHAVPLAALGGLSWAALVALRLVGSARRGGPAPREVIPSADAFMDKDIRSRIKALHRTHAELARVLAESPDAVRENMEPALVGVPELEEHAVVLARRAEDLADYLRTQDRKSIADEAARLQESASRATDQAARDEYGRAVAAVGEQLRALDDIVSARDRALANLSRIVSTLESLPARLVRMRALDDSARDALGNDTGSDLSRLNEEIRLFEKTLSSMVEPAAAPRSPR